MNIIELRKMMRECPQTPTANVLQHGFSVARYFLDLHNHLTKGTELKYEWRLPEWAYNPMLLEQLLDLKTILRYQIYHDCGKPFCRTVDDEGRQHFPDHAEWSYKIWKLLGLDDQEATLMRMDMDIHLMKGDRIDEFASRKEAATLMLTGLAELHSNASMFGGTGSVSFKIKHKQMSKMGKRILAQIESNSPSLYSSTPPINTNNGELL